MVVPRILVCMGKASYREQFTCSGSRVQELLKDVVGEQLPLRGETDCVAGQRNQARLFLAPHNFERRRNRWTPKLTLERGHLDPGIEPQAEEPGFFMLARRRDSQAVSAGCEPARNAARSSVVAERSTAVYPGPILLNAAPQHRRCVKSQAQIGPPLPIAEIVPGCEAGAAEIGNLILGQAGPGQPLDRHGSTSGQWHRPMEPALHGSGRRRRASRGPAGSPHPPRACRRWRGERRSRRAHQRLLP